MAKKQSSQIHGGNAPKIRQAAGAGEAGVRPGLVAPGGIASDARKPGGLDQESAVPSVADGFARSLDESVRRDIDRFIGNIEVGIDCWIKAGEILVKMKKDDPDVFTVISRLHPWATLDVLETMHSIGLKALHPRVLLLPPKIASSVAAMPYEAQKYVVESTAPISVVRQGNARPTDLKDISRSEAARVFRPEGIAAPEAQVFAKTELLGVWELSVLGTTLHARRVSNGISGRTLKISNGIVYVRLVK